MLEHVVHTLNTTLYRFRWIYIQSSCNCYYTLQPITFYTWLCIITERNCTLLQDLPIKKWLNPLLKFH